MKVLTLILTFCIIVAFSQARPIATKPQTIESLKLNQTQQKKAGGCSYGLVISTSCSSPLSTADQIDLSFGDAYGTQVYVPSLNELASGLFEACDLNTFEITGPCTTNQICYLYLSRTGPDGWMPEIATVSDSMSRTFTVYYDNYIPDGEWYGFNSCIRV
ncbi:embryo-specific protein ATS3A-like [Gastrolobium bilobum]|uniref:embryo-specific protein ATS3A-like n=1 Tax=Gastrolobium bilobum TaxID=150636 RepID=UPI002AB303BC|nr:embryo-specific protein ATS3A-like [Gastrolobium bilobum]